MLTSEIRILLKLVSQLNLFSSAQTPNLLIFLDSIA